MLTKHRADNSGLMIIKSLFTKRKSPVNLMINRAGFSAIEPDDDLLSHGNPHYHRREVVSLSCSGWEGVVPTCYGHQA